MMRTICIFLLLIGSSIASAQIVSEHDYAGDNLRTIDLNGVTHYAEVDYDQNEIRIYDSNHQLVLAFAIPVPAGATDYFVWRISDDVFASGPEVEYVLGYYHSSGQVENYVFTQSGTQLLHVSNRSFWSSVEVDGVKKLLFGGYTSTWAPQGWIYDPVTLQEEHHFVGKVQPVELETAGTKWMVINPDNGTITLYNGDLSQFAQFTGLAGFGQGLLNQRIEPSQHWFNTDNLVEVLVKDPFGGTGAYIFSENGTQLAHFPDAIGTSLLETPTQRGLFIYDGHPNAIVLDPLTLTQTHQFSHGSTGQRPFMPFDYITYLYDPLTETSTLLDDNFNLITSVVLPAAPLNHYNHYPWFITQDLLNPNGAYEIVYERVNQSTNYRDLMVMDDQGQLLGMIGEVKYKRCEEVDGEFKLLVTYESGGSAVYGLGAPPVGLPDHAQAETDGFTVYPNPSSGQVTVQLTDQTSTHSVLVRNLQGQVVEANAAGGDRSELDLSQLSAGMYVLEVSNGQHSYSQPLVIR